MWCFDFGVKLLFFLSLLSVRIHFLPEKKYKKIIIIIYIYISAKQSYNLGKIQGVGVDV